jgi:hypothetical protein
MSERATMWWTLRDVVDWVRRIDPPVTIRQIRVALERGGASGRIRAHGRRWAYRYDHSIPIDHQNLEFVGYSATYGGPQSWFDTISADEWKDLTFFARPTPAISEPYHVALTLALDQLVSPVELRSEKKFRIAWTDVEFRRADVIREWSHAGDAADPNEAEREPLSGVAGEATGGTPAWRSSSRGPAPLSPRDPGLWYKGRVAELMRRGETSSGEDELARGEAAIWRTRHQSPRAEGA